MPVHHGLSTLVSLGERARSPDEGLAPLALKIGDPGVNPAVATHTIRTLMEQTQILKEANVVGGHTVEEHLIRERTPPEVQVRASVRERLA